jgi:hypothetical protein
VGLQRPQDGHIGDQQKEEDEHTDEPTVGSNEEPQSMGISTGQFKQRVQITHEVIDDIRTTER